MNFGNWFHRILAIFGCAAVVLPQVAPILPGKASTVAVTIGGVAALVVANANKIAGKPQP